MSNIKSMESRYAGDRAWRNWFRICSVAGCPEPDASGLRQQVSSAMYAQLVRSGCAREDAEGDDPVVFFDGYFMLKGSRDKAKPLKSYFAYRIETEGLRLIDFVCGTLFGSLSGRIHDIVVDWIASLKGWKPRTLRGTDGRRHVVWENAGEEDIAALEQPVSADPAAMMDVEPLRRLADGLIENISRKIKAEKQKVGLLLYATAQDISLTESAVLEALGTAKTRAYALKEKVMKAMRNELKERAEAADPLFARVLLEACAETLPEGLRAKLGGQS